MITIHQLRLFSLTLIQTHPLFKFRSLQETAILLEQQQSDLLAPPCLQTVTTAAPAYLRL